MTNERPLKWLSRMLGELGLRYAVIGAHAVNAWVEPRFTADIDVTIELTADQSRRLAESLGSAGLARTGILGADSPSGPDFVRFSSPDRSLTLEFQTAKTELQHELVRRAVVGADGLRVATAEDLIVLKLIANRTKDQLDLLELAALAALDWAYIERWAREWDVLGLLRELQKRAAR